MIKLIKKSLFILIYKAGELYLRHKGVSTGADCRVLGKAFVKKHPSSSISIGSGCNLISSVRFHPMCNQPVRFNTTSAAARIELADHVGITGASLNCSLLIRIGSKCMIGPDVYIRDDDGHMPGPDGTWPGCDHLSAFARPVIIEESCFIGTKAIILKGVTIGRGSVVAAGCVVSKDIPSEHLAFGNPMQLRPLPENLKYKNDGEAAM